MTLGLDFFSNMFAAHILFQSSSILFFSYKKKLRNIMYWLSVWENEVLQSMLLCLCVCNGAILLWLIYAKAVKKMKFQTRLVVTQQKLHFHKTTMLDEREKLLIHQFLNLIANSVDQNHFPVHASSVNNMLFIAIDTTRNAKN